MDLFKQRCRGCGAIHQVRTSCTVCVEKKQRAYVASAGPSARALRDGNRFEFKPGTAPFPFKAVIDANVPAHRGHSPCSAIAELQAWNEMCRDNGAPGLSGQAAMEWLAARGVEFPPLPEPEKPKPKTELEQLCDDIEGMRRADVQDALATYGTRRMFSMTKQRRVPVVGDMQSSYVRIDIRPEVLRHALRQRMGTCPKGFLIKLTEQQREAMQSRF